MKCPYGAFLRLSECALRADRPLPSHQANRRRQSRITDLMRSMHAEIEENIAEQFG
jgi:hypothetical protein